MSTDQEVVAVACSREGNRGCRVAPATQQSQRIRSPTAQWRKINAWNPLPVQQTTTSSLTTFAERRVCSCHVRTARSAIDPSQRLGRVHGMSCRSIYATLHYRWLSSMHIWRPIYFPSRVGPRHICDIYDFFAPHINVFTYFLTYGLNARSLHSY